ncbi:hypothetical protein NPIL_355321 [Nephila pilipes]|uniref:Uncharacterized protein n=1 Tax=Nephila pilipes TaxID=299642 RepID=A0A8X6QSJ7_NEPPI|nr:hypothetical protein NPIL_355321 [Nephila pilipes]
MEARSSLGPTRKPAPPCLSKFVRNVSSAFALWGANPFCRLQNRIEIIRTNRCYSSSPIRGTDTDGAGYITRLKSVRFLSTMENKGSKRKRKGGAEKLREKRRKLLEESSRDLTENFSAEIS